MFKMSKKRKHIHILDGMSLYTRDRSPFYWGYLNVGGKIFKKSLKTTDRKEAEKLLFAWKNEIFSNSMNLSDVQDHTEDHDHSKQEIIVDDKRRKALLITSGVMGAVTVAGFAVPFLSAWKPSERNSSNLSAPLKKPDASASRQNLPTQRSSWKRRQPPGATHLPQYGTTWWTSSWNPSTHQGAGGRKVGSHVDRIAQREDR